MGLFSFNIVSLYIRLKKRWGGNWSRNCRGACCKLVDIWGSPNCCRGLKLENVVGVSWVSKLEEVAKCRRGNEIRRCCMGWWSWRLKNIAGSPKDNFPVPHFFQSNSQYFDYSGNFHNHTEYLHFRCSTNTILNLHPSYTQMK